MGVLSPRPSSSHISSRAPDKRLHPLVVGPPVCSHNPSWLVLMMESSVMLGVVDVVIVVEVDARTKVVGEPLMSKWLMKVK